MKCRFCSQWFEIHTDPKHSRYIVVRGARKKVEDYDGEDIDAITLSDEEEKARRVKDPMYSLEHRVLDKRKADEALERLTELKVGRKIRKAQQEESEQIQGRLGLNFPIMPEHEDDKAEAKLVIFGDPEREESQRLAALTAKPLVEKPPRKAPSIPDIRAATRKSDTKPTTKNNGGSSGGSGRGAGLDLKHAICISLRKRNDPFLDTQFGEPKTAGKTPSRTAAHQDALEPSTGNRSSGGAATVSLGVLVKKRSQQSEGVPAAKDAALDGLGHLTSADYQSSSDSE
ncbi:Protein saf4 [Spiromyces aspiralis]|uniref:Protein saf4 n=1 Tax=Spiromyces aspiralis TaxID=68401 RepID=A0ACC1HQC4_9FUNG|nr:Protein saf4 [Spiromyces aspiralis]